MDAPRRRLTTSTAAGALMALVATGAASGAEGTQTPDPTASSPAGSPIVYQWVQGDGDGIFLMDADGSDARPLLADLGTSTYHPDWSPDGSRLAFEAEGDSGWSIWLSQPDGTDPVELVDPECPPDCADPVYPAWSPDGMSIAFSKIGFGDAGIFSSIEVVDVASGETRTVHTSPTGTVFEYPRWSPDGASIVYSAVSFSTDSAEPGTETGSWIEIVAADGSGEPSTLTDPSMFAAYPDWGPHDTIVFTTYDLAAFQSTDEASNLYTIRPDGSGMTQVTQFAGGGQRATQPTWTPDGWRILFTLTLEFDDRYRQAAFLDTQGGDLTVLEPFATHPRLQPSLD